MPKFLEIAELGNQILREKTKAVEDVADLYTQNLIDDMIYTVAEVNGVGLAAPQISQPLQIFIVASSPNPRYPDAPEIEPIAIINPSIIKKSDEMEKNWEGCLSIPGIRGLVPRNKFIEVKYLDRFGKEKKEQFSDFLARIFQHEYDHLNGIVFLDRMKSTKDIITEKEYIKLFD